MPRPKGSKNKPKTVKSTVDFAAQITEKQAAKKAAAAEIASITANIDALKADLKTKKAELKSIDKEIARTEAKKVKAETKAAEAASKRYERRRDPRKAEINILEPCGSVGA